MRFESQLSRMNCQMFSCGLSSGHLAGSGIQGDVGGNLQAAGKTPSGLIEEDGGVSVRRNLGGDLGEMQVHRSVSQRGMMSAAPLPSLGQIAPKI